MKAAKVFSTQPEKDNNVNSNCIGSHLLTTDGCHRNRRACSAFYGYGNVTRHFGGDGDVTLVGSWCWGNKTTWHR